MGITVQSNIIITKTRKTDIEKIDFATCAEPTETLDKYYSRQTEKPDILINGGLFAFATGKPVMDLIDEGTIQASEDWIQYGFGIDTLGNLLYAKDSDKLWRDFISAYPPLVVNGQIQTITMATEISGKTRRTILGYDDTYIYTISVDNPGATLVETAIIAQNAGCKYAINLDGGGSTRLLYQGKVYAAASYNRPVDNVVAIYFKKEKTEMPTTNGYRIQVGAFPDAASAQAYADKIKALGSDFSNTIVKYVAPYYKVYTGAFINQSDANVLVSKLKNKGFSGFIVSMTIEETTQTPVNSVVGDTKSSLTAVTIISPNRVSPRTHAIDRITPHCVVGQCTAETLGNYFAKSATNASSNYGIDKDGRVGLYVEETDRSWCSSNVENDNRAITIECASDAYAPYKFNDACYNTLINLCVDICKRYGKTKLLWLNDKNTALNYEPKSNEMVLTVHRWFANKACPGDWLMERMGDLAEKVNIQLATSISADTDTITPVDSDKQTTMTQEQFNTMMDNWLAEQAKKEPSSWSANARKWAESKKYVNGDENGNKMYKKPITREEVIQILYNINK